MCALLCFNAENALSNGGVGTARPPPTSPPGVNDCFLWEDPLCVELAVEARVKCEAEIPAAGDGCWTVCASRDDRSPECVECRWNRVEACQKLYLSVLRECGPTLVRLRGSASMTSARSTTAAAARPGRRA